MKKRILSLFTTVCMLAVILPALPTAAFDMGKVGEYQTISAGDYHTAAIKEDGSLWAWGYNSCGQLGDGTAEHKNRPIKIMDNVVAVSAGGNHTAAIKADGNLWTWGYGLGLFGDGTIEDKYSPTKIMDNVVAVSAGGYHTAAIKTDGSLWTWGSNGWGQLGDGTEEHKTTPIKIMDNVAAVSAGYGHTVAIKTDGSLWAWGRNGDGQLGDGTTEDKHSPIKIMDNVSAVSAGWNHTAAIKTDDSLWTWGDNDDGQLGTGSMRDEEHTPIKIMDDVVSVSVGYCHSAVIKKDNSFWEWGEFDGNGAIGYGPRPNQIMDNVATVSAGRYHTVVTKTDGTLLGWGFNGYGQLGDSTTKSIDIPIKDTPIKVMDGVRLPGGGAAVTPTTPEPTGDEYSFYVPSEMNIGDVYGAYVTYGHESLDSSSNFRFVDAQMTSSDENVVKLVKLGNSYRVQATGEGTATVTAYFEGKTETQNVTVTAEIAETLDDETVLKAKICADNGSYQYMRDAFEIPATLYAKELDGTAAAANEAINAMIGAANGDYTVKNYYEIVLTEMLANEEFYNAIKRKYAINHTSAIIGDANSLVSTALEQYNTTDVPVNQILQVPKESLKDAFDISKFANTLDVESISALDLIDAMLIVNDTVEVYNEKYDQLLYLATATQEQLSVLEGLANSSSGNEEFRDACKSVARLIVETANMSITDMQAESTLAGVDNFIDKIGSTAVSGLRNLIPGMAIGDAIVGGTKFITNALFNADALANDEIMLKAFEYIDSIVKQEMKDSEDKFNSNPTAENAIEFMAYADFYQTLCAYGCDLAIQFINDYENAGVSGAWGADVSGDKDAVERIKGYVTDWDFYSPNGTDIAKYLRVTVSTSPSGWAEEYVNKAINNNMLPDYMQNNYQNNITRAEFCSLMTCCFEAKTGESIHTLIEKYGDPGLQTPFDDCMYTFAAYMSKLGIVTGMGDNTFYPLGEITRQQAATMLMRAAEVLGYDVSAPETNLSGVADWAADGVNFVVDRGIMTGTDNGFEPEGTYTKEQAITTMVRFYENFGN